jgi:hypothetical protein
MTQIEERELFGGAITGAVPQGWIDGRFVYSSLLETYLYQDIGIHTE